jgi:hypothetical protein
MVLVAHYDRVTSEGCKDTFLNEDLYEKVYMAQPKRFCHERKRT